MRTTILVVGGAGYIGANMVNKLLNAGYSVITFDNLSHGYRDAVIGGEFIRGDLHHPTDLAQVFKQYQIDGVMHFASFIEVGESLINPGKYYQNNVAATLNLLDAMVAHQVSNLIFSSSAAIFGEPHYLPIDEQHPKQPINPYGLSKWMIEQILADYERAYQLKSICLRYFNAAGAAPDPRLRERHHPETHLIPLVLQVAAGQRPHITIFGEDYPTFDGSCIRDYIHVDDLCQAHLLALQHLFQGGPSAAYNLGNGQGFSVKQVIDTARQITRHPIPTVLGNRRIGDPASLIADARLAITQLHWQPRYPELATLIDHAWQVHTHNTL